MLKVILSSIMLMLISHAVIAKTPITIKIFGINDFHGQISVGQRKHDRPVGSAAVMSAYLKQAEKGYEKNSVITFSGDQVGASTPASGLLNDEPTILFFNTLANNFCRFESRLDPQCNLVATLGNHEFDKGTKALFDKIYGSDKPPTDHWIPLAHYPGATFPYISANIVDAKSGKNLFPSYIIKNINGIKIAFIGAILKNAPDVIIPSSIENVKFLDESEAINRTISEVKAQGATVIVVLIHQGGKQIPYEGDTQENQPIDGDIINIVKRLDDSVDIVMAGHTHAFLNTFLNNQHGKKILVTEANSYSSDFVEVTLTVDDKNNKILHESARVITTYADQFPGTKPDLDASKIVKLAEDKVAPIINSQVGTVSNDLLKKQNDAGESNLGNLIADAMRKILQTDIALMNSGGIRANVYAGKITRGNLYAVQPFGNELVKIALSGDDIYQLLEQQWTNARTSILQISGITYSYNVNKPIGNRIITIYQNNLPIVRNKLYTIATNNFLAYGGDEFTILRKSKILADGGTDLNALVNYVKALPQPFSINIEGRIKKVSGLF